MKMEQTTGKLPEQPAQPGKKQELLKKLLDETARLREEVDCVRALLAAQQNARYEYHMEVVQDHSTGGTSSKAMAKVFAQMQEDGWRLVQAFTNEVGVNSTTTAIGGQIKGNNATVDQVILIFERRVS